jgi:hypothetical protein
MGITMNSTVPAVALLRALVVRHVDNIGRSMNLHSQAADDAARRLMTGFTLNDATELATRSGENIEDYITGKLSLMRTDPASAHLFMIESGGLPEPQHSRPAHKVSAREKLDIANKIDPFVGI